MSSWLHAVPAWARLTGSPLCAVEQAALCRDAFSNVCIVMNQTGPLIERIHRLDLDHVLIPVEYSGARSRGLFRLLRSIPLVVRTRVRYVLGVRRWLKERPGVLHVHSRVLCAMYACLAGRLARLPVVLTLHEPPASCRLQAVIDGCWIRLFVDEIVAASAATAAEHRPYLGKRPIHVVHYCMSAMPPARKGQRPSRPVAAFIGLVARKRYMDFLTACLQLKQKGVDFEAWLVGDWDGPADRKQAENFIAQHGLEDVVKPQGLIQDMDALYRSMTVLAVPSEPIEALPRVVMEAMSYGIPVVATSVNGVPEMVVEGETGFLIDVGDVTSLADRLERLLCDPALRERMGRAGRARAEQLFAPGRFQRDMLDIYRGMIQTVRKKSGPASDPLPDSGGREP